MGGNDLKVPSS